MPVRREDGFTLAELLMAMATSIVILTAILAMVQVSTRGQARVADRVAANQRGRPVLARLMNELHSGCVAPGVAPVLSGSTDSSIGFLSKSGSDVSPVPDKHIVTLTGSTLSESIYPAIGGAQPSWTFSSTPSSTRQLLTGVSAGQAGSPTAGVPLFRYYAYTGGQISSTPLSTPLSTNDAARAAQVTVSFATSPGDVTVPAPTPISLSDSATLRLEPASEDSSEVNLPCV
jgi:hypothetical protein